MLLARFAPVESNRYESLSAKAKSLEKVVEWLSPQLFAIWIIFVAGMSAGKAQLERYYFWDWSDWLIGTIGLLVITTILNILGKKSVIVNLNSNDYLKNNSTYHILLPIIIFYLGYVIMAGFQYLFAVAIYIMVYYALYVIHTIQIDDKKNAIDPDSKKYIKALFALILLFVAVVLGFINDDPLISTASVVTIPFLIVLLFGQHVRHLERAKFYPIFIFAMFVCSREAWFIIPLFLLFHFLRSYNYLRHQKVYPTFGVSDDSN